MLTVTYRTQVYKSHIQMYAVHILTQEIKGPKAYEMESQELLHT